MARRPVHGTCHLCGAEGKLSFEHVPPRAAFNDRPVVLATIDEILQKGDLEEFRGRTEQRGVGSHTLCVRCNNTTGHWYGGGYVEWAYQGMTILASADGSPRLYYPFKIFPLRVIKQIVCMFFSANGPEFRTANPYLQQLALDKQRRYLPPEVKIYTFYNISPKIRLSGVSAVIRLGQGMHIVGEVTFPPFGYLMVMASAPPDPRPYDISYFAEFGYDEFKVLPLSLPVLPVSTPFPADYRSAEQVKKEVEEQRRHRS